MVAKPIQRMLEVAGNKYPKLHPRAACVAFFIEEFCTVEGPSGEPKRFELLRWQLKVLNDIYSNGIPGEPLDVNRALISMGRKNGKTEFGSALIVVHAAGPEAPSRNGQIICAGGASQDQAGIAFEGALRMMTEHPYLARHTETRENRIFWKKDTVHNHVKTISTKSESAQGLRPSFWLYDELAESKNRTHLDSLEYSQVPAKGTLGVIVSTRSAHPQSVFAAVYEEIMDAHLNGFGKQWCINVWSADAAAGDIWTPEQLKAANPAVGEILDLDMLVAEMEIKKRSPLGRSEFKARRLNLATSTKDALIDQSMWLDLADPEKPTKDEVYARMAGKKVQIAADLGMTGSLSSLGLYWPTERYVIARNWMAKKQAEHFASIHRAPYFEWHEMGHIELVASEVHGGMSYGPIAEEIIKIFDLFEVISFRYDPYQIERLFDELRYRGWDHEIEPLCLVLKKFRQGAPSYGEAIAQFEDSIMNGNLMHDGNPCTNFSINVTEVTEANNVAGSKMIAKTSSDHPNDAGAAILMAHSSMGEKLHEEELGLDFVDALYAAGDGVANRGDMW